MSDEVPRETNVINLPEGGPDIWHEDMKDPEALLNVRDFIEGLLTVHPNVEMTDAGIGVGGADLGVLIEGYPFKIQIIPRDK